MLKIRSYSTAGATPLRRLCIANRGEIVTRVQNTAAKMGINSTVVYSDADRDLAFASSAFTNLSLGPASANGYIDIEKIVKTAKSAACDAIHPGYGFLSENANFAKRVREEGLIFVGPPQDAIEAMGAKDRSKEIMEAAGVACVPGYHGTNQDPAFLAKKADEITYPVLIKAVLGGGGKGMRIVESPEQFASALQSAKSEALSSFGDDNVLVEKYIKTPRHVEVQVFADRHGNVVALGERDCSVQRRHQKVLEESPAPGLDEETRQLLWKNARDAARAVGYEGAGTVEFILDNDSGKFYFMEMNTRLQVEHPVTEAVLDGIDLVEWQLLVAAGYPLPKTQDEITFSGHAFEARIYCEDPFQNFLPSAGKIEHLQKSYTDSPRLDFTFRENDTVSSLYDPMIGKLIVKGATRTEALMKMHLALQELEIVGPTTNIEFVKRVVENENFGGESPSGLETGFIPKNGPQLFEHRSPSPLVVAQAAIATVLEGAKGTSLSSFGWDSSSSHVVELYDGETKLQALVTPAGSGAFVVRFPDGAQIEVEHAAYDGPKLHTIVRGEGQFKNTAIVLLDTVHVFHNGVHHTFGRRNPEWLTGALGEVARENSVVAPMPCTVARINTAVGDHVTKDQELLVILSMKMETIVRSPKDGVIKKIAFSEGDLAKQGAVLVEFEDS